MPVRAVRAAKWYVKVSSHYWHQILLSVLLWRKWTTKRCRTEGSFSPFYSGRALDVRTRWNSIFCRVARISMSPACCFRFLPASARGRSRVAGEKQSRAVDVSWLNESLRFFFFFLRVSDTVNIDTEFYLRFHTYPRESCASDTLAGLFVSIRYAEIWRNVFEKRRTVLFEIYKSLKIKLIFFFGEYSLMHLQRVNFNVRQLFEWRESRDTYLAQ